MTVFRGLKNRWLLLLVTCVLVLGLKHYLRDPSNYSHYAQNIYRYFFHSGSSPRAQRATGTR